MSSTLIAREKTSMKIFSLVGGDTIEKETSLNCAFCFPYYSFRKHTFSFDYYFFRNSSPHLLYLY